MNQHPNSAPKALLTLCALLVAACASQPRKMADPPRPEPAPAAAASALSLLPIYAEDLRFGPATADVTLVTFLDFARPASREAYLQLRFFAESAAGKHTRIIFKHAPSLAEGEVIARAAVAVQRAKGDIASLAFLDDVARSAALSEAELVESAFTTTGEPGPVVPNVSIQEQVQRDLTLQGEVGSFGSEVYVNGARLAEDTQPAELERKVSAEAVLARALKPRYSDPEAIYALRVQDNLREVEQRVDTTSPLSERGQVPSWGSPGAPVTIVAFLDFQCPFCSRVMPTLDRLREHYGADRLRIVYRHNPLPFHRDAPAAHEAAAAVFALGGNPAFSKFQRLAFEHQKELTPENLVAWAVQAGVPRAKFEAASGKYASVIEADIKLAREVGATGTPAFRINGLVLSGAQPFDRFRELVDDQLRKAAELRSRGVSARQLSALLTKEQYTQPPPPKSVEPTPPDTTVWQIPVSKDDPVQGPADALVTIVEFGDLQCPFTARVQNTLDDVVKRYGGDVRVVWKDNLLPFHPRATAAATAARAVFESNGNAAFFTTIHQIFANQKDLSDDGLVAAAAGTGVSPQRVRKALTQLPYAALFARSMSLAQDMQARGTPHFFINGRRLSGAQPLEKFTELIDQQLVLARNLVSTGIERKQIYDTLMKSAQGAPEPEVKSALPPISAAPFRGPANAKLVIEIFSDFQCPYCNRVRATLDLLHKEHPAIKFVWRNMPLAFHPDAPLAAEAAHEVFVQLGSKRFWQYHDALFEAQSTGIGRETLEKLARQLGVNMKQFRAALDSRKHKARIEADMDAASKAGINGTPGFIVGKYFLSGAQPLEAFKRLIEKQ